MKEKVLEEEIESLKTTLRKESFIYTEAVSNKNRQQMASLELRINELLCNLKSKSREYESIKGKN